MKIASIADVKAHLSAYLKTAAAQGPVIVTKNSRPVAVLLPIDDEEEIERLMMAYSPRLQSLLQAAKQRIEAGKGIPSADFWQQVRVGSATAAKKRNGRRAN
jgi:prevent-host-death family protein